DRGAEITRRAGSVLDANCLEPAMPVQPLVTNPGAVPVAVGNDHARRCGAAVARGESEPAAPETGRSLEVVEAHVDVALDVVAVLRRDVGPRARGIPHGHLAEPEIHIFDPAAIAAHVEGIEIVDLDGLAAVVPLTRPDLAVR